MGSLQAARHRSRRRSSTRVAAAGEDELRRFLALDQRDATTRTVIARSVSDEAIQRDDFRLSCFVSRAVHLSPAGRGRIAIAIRVRGTAITKDRNPSPRPLSKERGGTPPLRLGSA